MPTRSLRRSGSKLAPSIVLPKSVFLLQVALSRDAGCVLPIAADESSSSRPPTRMSCHVQHLLLMDLVNSTNSQQSTFLPPCLWGRKFSGAQRLARAPTHMATHNVPARSSSLLLVGSAALNILLVVALLAHQQFDSALSTHRLPSARTTWCPPRPEALPGVVASAVGGVGMATAFSATSPPPPSAATVALSASSSSSATASASLLEAISTDERRLKHIWQHPNDQRTARARLVEIHDSRWTFLDDRQMARGLSTVGDPLRLRCLAEKLLAGEPRISVLGGSVSFGTTFTTSRSRALFHWKVSQYLNASFPRPRGAQLPHPTRTSWERCPRPAHRTWSTASRGTCRPKAPTNPGRVCRQL